MKLVKVAVTTTGSAGSGAGSGTSTEVLSGKLYAVYLDYEATAPGATTDVVISQAEAPTATLLTVADNATDGWYFPRNPVCGTTGTGLTYDGTRTVNEPLPIGGHITVTVAQSNALTDCVVAYLYIEE